MSQVFAVTLDDKDWTATCENLAAELKKKIDGGENVVVIHDPEVHQISELSTMESALRNHARRCPQRRI